MPHEISLDFLSSDGRIFRALVENSNSAELTIVTAPDGIVAFVSSQCEAVIGYPEERFIGKRFPDIIHPDDVERCKAEWAAVVLEGRHIQNFEYRIVDAAEKIRWISHSAGSLIIDGLLIGMQNSIRDITDRKVVELHLLESQQFNEMILNASPDVIYVYDIVEKQNVYSNNGIMRVLGYSVSEIKDFGESLIQKLMHPDDFEVYLSSTLPKYQTIADGEFIEHEYRMVHKEGHWCRLACKETIFQRTKDGSPKQIFGLISDITKQWEDDKRVRAAHVALEASETKYRHLFEHMNSAFALHEIVTDDSGRPVDYVFLEVNDEFVKMTGLSRESILGKRVTEALPGIQKDPADWIGKYGSVALSGETLRFMQYAEPLSKWYAVVVYAPTERQFATIFMDITEQKKLEERLIESEKMQAIGQLAGGIAHDFNNQLAGIVGYADLLNESAEPGSEAALYSEKILLATKRAADLTSQLLAFARKGKYLSVSVDLRDLISETLDILRHTIDRRIKIRQNHSADVPRVVGDPSQLQNALMNLALNARDAMPEGGELCISTRLVHLNETYCQRHSTEISPGQFVELTVTDTGFGMDAETQGKIFEPFFTTKSLQKGTGMGLSATWGTVRNHGGIIDVDSEPGRGTAMRILLPYAPEEGALRIAPDPAKLHRGSARVLLVDDEPMVLETGLLMLKKLGYTVTTASNGAEALSIFGAKFKEIDIVILDMVMPTLDGRQTYLRMREIDPGIRVLLSSGYSFDGAAQKLLNEGVNGFIQKPFRMPKLSKKLAELVPPPSADAVGSV